MEYHPGDVVIRQGDCVGDEDDGLFIITKGELEVVDVERGKLATIYQGHSFGEMALISKDGGRRKCDVVAISNVDLRVLTRHIFNRLASRYPELKARLKEQTKMILG